MMCNWTKQIEYRRKGINGQNEDWWSLRKVEGHFFVFHRWDYMNGYTGENNSDGNKEYPLEEFFQTNEGQRLEAKIQELIEANQ